MNTIQDYMTYCSDKIIPNCILHYDYIIYCIVFIIILIIIKKYAYRNRTNKNIHFYYFYPLQKNIFLDTIIHIFGFSFLHNYSLRIIISHTIETNDCIDYYIQSQFTYQTAILFLNHKQSHVSFFITSTGILYGIRMSSEEDNCTNQHASDLIIKGVLEKKKYTITANHQTITDAELQTIIPIIKEFLYK
jgi:hypothetical protein